MLASLTSLAQTQNLEQCLIEEGSIYYWRVRARSICSTGKYSETKAFRTASDGCVQYVNDTPVEIEADDVGEVESILEVPMDIDFSQAKVTLDISHTFTGDLSAEIASPTNVITGAVVSTTFTVLVNDDVFLDESETVYFNIYSPGIDVFTDPLN